MNQHRCHPSLSSLRDIKYEPHRQQGPQQCEVEDVVRPSPTAHIQIPASAKPNPVWAPVSSGVAAEAVTKEGAVIGSEARVGSPSLRVQRAPLMVTKQEHPSAQTGSPTEQFRICVVMLAGNGDDLLAEKF